MMESLISITTTIVITHYNVIPQILTPKLLAAAIFK